MFSKHVKLLGFLLTLSVLLETHNAQRTHSDANLRGQSFGLENFLFQNYEDVSVRPKRIRPTPGSYRTTTSYGLETSQQYESSRLKATSPKLRRPVEPVPESSRITENYVLKKEEQVSEITKEKDVAVQEVVTERIRKRIMMRRRRKRPSNAVPVDDNSEITGNAILKPVKIPVFPQVPKVVIRTKLPDQDRLKPVSVPITIPVTEEQERTTVTEKSTTTTTEASTTSKPSTINLKTFLKQQTETLSLSELLQTQNLSLADLLRDNKDASAILKARQSIPSTTPSTTTTTTFKRKFTTEPEPTKKPEIIEATTSRPNYNRFLPKIPRIKPIEENRDEENLEERRPVKRPSLGANTQNRLNELRSKLRNFQRKPTQPETTSPAPTRDETIEPAPLTTTETPPHKKNRVSFKSANNPDISLILPTKPKPEPENIKRPERPTTWTNRLPSIKRFGQDRPKPENIPPKPLKVPILESSEEVDEPTKTPTPTPEEFPPEETRKPESKDDLIELLKSGQNADKLQKILHTRNMTIQELLDNREKPTLQTDIAQLFSNKKPAETTPPTLFDSLPDFEIQENNEFQGKDMYDEPEAEESALHIAKVELMPGREAKQFEFPVSEKEVESELNLQPDDSAAENSALWKLSEKAVYYGNSYGYGNYPPIQQTEKPKNMKTELTDSDIILLETIRRSQETNRKFKLDLKDFMEEEEQPEAEDIEKSYIPPAVKSAIIASGVVMGIALFVFIAIFAACGWKQRQIRLKGSSSSTKGTDKLNRTNTLSPVSFKDSHSYKKTIDFDEESSESGSSHTSSYLWNTLKNTFRSRTSTLKSRLEKEEKMREDKTTLRRNESRRKVNDSFETQDDRYTIKKIDRDRNVINTSFNFKRSESNNNLNRFNDCVHGY